jgi:hypothetical protein
VLVWPIRFIYTFNAATSVAKFRQIKECIMVVFNFRKDRESRLFCILLLSLFSIVAQVVYLSKYRLFILYNTLFIKYTLYYIIHMKKNFHFYICFYIILFVFSSFIFTCFSDQKKILFFELLFLFVYIYIAHFQFGFFTFFSISKRNKK